MHSSFVKATASVTLLAFSSCVSSTLINTRPPGARVFLDGQQVGTTPYTMSDTKMVGSTTTVRLEKDGYEPVNTVIARSEELDVGPLIAGLFLCLIPLLWVEKYRPVHDYDMQPLAGGPASYGQPPQQPYPPPQYPQQQPYPQQPYPKQQSYPQQQYPQQQPYPPPPNGATPR